jgi:hypothetical protein
MKSTLSTPRSEARGMLSLPAGRQGLILSGLSNSILKGWNFAESKYQLLFFDQIRFGGDRLF